MAKSKAERKAERLEKKEKRMAAEGEIFATKIRIGGGFIGTYLLTQSILPAVSTTVAENQEAVDAVTGIGLGLVGAFNSGPIGDVAFGGAQVGVIQTLDNIGAKFQEWRAKNP